MKKQNSFLLKKTLNLIYNLKLKNEHHFSKISFKWKNKTPKSVPIVPKSVPRNSQNDAQELPKWYLRTPKSVPNASRNVGISMSSSLLKGLKTN